MSGPFQVLKDKSYPHTVRIEFRPYAHSAVRELLDSVVKDFGKVKQRWKYSSVLPENSEPNAWVVDFQFQDPYDATVFGLKYTK